MVAAAGGSIASFTNLRGAHGHDTEGVRRVCVGGCTGATGSGKRGGSDEETFNGQAVTTGGDVIVAVDGRPVGSADEIVREVSSRLPGETIRLTVVRGQTRKTVTAKLGARPDTETNP